MSRESTVFNTQRSGPSDDERPLAIDLFCGVGGWTDGLLLEGYRVIGFDIERHIYDEHRYPAQLVLQDVLSLHGYQFRQAALIVASPPCQFFSYTAMPWTRAKQLAIEVRADPERTAKELALFNACFRIQAEACEWAGRHVPLIVENVRGAQEWVGRARWNFGSYFLWGDVPALMPIVRMRKFNPDRVDHPSKNEGGSWFNISNGKVNDQPRNARDDLVAYKSRGLNWSKRDQVGNDFTRVAGAQALGIKGAGPRWDAATGHSGQVGRWTNPAEGVKHRGSGDVWFDTGPASLSSHSAARKAASAMIAKIPLPLARYIASVYRPLSE